MVKLWMILVILHQHWKPTFGPSPWNSKN